MARKPSAAYTRARLAVVARMNAKRITPAEIVKKTGIGTEAANDLYYGRRSRSNPDTIAAVEDAIGWEPGTFEAVGAGADPPPLDDVRGINRGERRELEERIAELVRGAPDEQAEAFLSVIEAMRSG